MPQETFTRSVTIDAPVADVWAAMDSVDTWSSIGGVDRVFDPIIDSDGRLRGFSFESSVGGKRYVGSATPADRIEQQLISWNIKNSEIRGTTTVALEPDGASTKLEVTLHVESVGMLSSMFFPVIAGTLGRGLPAAVESFVAGFTR